MSKGLSKIDTSWHEHSHNPFTPVPGLAASRVAVMSMLASSSVHIASTARLHRRVVCRANVCKPTICLANSDRSVVTTFTQKAASAAMALAASAAIAAGAPAAVQSRCNSAVHTSGWLVDSYLFAGPALAAKGFEPVNNPQLLPKDFQPVVDVAGFLTPGQVRMLFLSPRTALTMERPQPLARAQQRVSPLTAGGPA